MTRFTLSIISVSYTDSLLEKSDYSNQVLKYFLSNQDYSIESIVAH